MIFHRILVSACLLLPTMALSQTASTPAGTANNDAALLKARITILQKAFETAEVPAKITKELDQDISSQPRMVEGFALAFADWVTARTPSNPGPSGMASSDTAQNIYPTAGKRIWQSISLGAEFIQQPKTIEEYSTTLNKNVQSLNTQRWLWKGTLTMDGSALFPSTSDVQSQATALSGVKTTNPNKVAGTICDAKDFLRCVLRTGPTYRFQRVMSGFKGKVSFVQNPKVDNGVLVPSQDALANTTVAGESDFDPSSIALSADDWSNAYKIIKAYENEAAESSLASLVGAKCGITQTIHPETISSLFLSKACIDALSGPQGWKAALLLIPTATFTEKTNFDYIANNGILIPELYPSKRLADLTFSVNFNRLLSSSKSRQTALATLVSLAKDCQSSLSTCPGQPLPPLGVPGKAEKDDAVTSALKTDLNALVSEWAQDPSKIVHDRNLYAMMLMDLAALAPAKPSSGQ